MNHSATVSERRSFAERIIGGPEGFRLLLQRLGPTFTKIAKPTLQCMFEPAK